MIANLIFDIGAHRGDDTEFYVAKGFRVVAVEPNPLLISELHSRFSKEINSGAVVIEACGISNNAGQLEFYAHDHDDWSTFEKNSRFIEGNHRVFLVDTKPIESIISKYGVPYYMKVDIEGSEKHIVNNINKFDEIPNYFSFEDNVHTDEHLRTLCDLGYTWFKVIDQSAKPGQEIAPNPPLEGNYIPFNFTSYMSGAFGRELPGVWQDEFGLEAEMAKIREDRSKGIWHRWYDIHCKRKDVS